MARSSRHVIMLTLPAYFCREAPQDGVPPDTSRGTRLAQTCRPNDRVPHAQICVVLSVLQKAPTANIPHAGFGINAAKPTPATLVQMAPSKLCFRQMCFWLLHKLLFYLLIECSCSMPGLPAVLEGKCWFPFAALHRFRSTSSIWPKARYAWEFHLLEQIVSQGCQAHPGAAL
jgi:hypothetical protein